jgi:hypothetical protein
MEQLEPSEMTFFLRRSWPAKPYTAFMKYAFHDASLASGD